MQDCSLFKREIKKKKWRKRLQALMNSIATKDWTTVQKTGKISIKTGHFFNQWICIRYLLCAGYYGRLFILSFRSVLMAKLISLYHPCFRKHFGWLGSSSEPRFWFSYLMQWHFMESHWRQRGGLGQKRNWAISLYFV